MKNKYVLTLIICVIVLAAAARPKKKKSQPKLWFQVRQWQKLLRLPQHRHPLLP